MIQVIEKDKSRSSEKGRRYNLKFMVNGTTSPDEAQQAAEYYIQERGIETKYPLDSINIDPVHVEEANPQNSYWDVDLNFVPAELQMDNRADEENPFLNKVSYSTCSSSEHISHSLATVLAVPSSAVDYNRAIGVSSDGIKGIDIRTGTLKISIGIQIPYGYTNKTYQTYLDSMLFKVNDGTFLNRPKRCVQFVGGEGAAPGYDMNFDFVLNFEIRREETDIKISDDIIVPQKYGWDYLWIKKNKQKIEVNGKKYIQEVPVAAYVEQVYPQTDLSVLFKKVGE